MKISVHKEEKEILIQTVSLNKDLINPNNLYLFRCPYCSTGITQIQGLVNKISPGQEPNEDVVVIHQCSKCKRLYTFQTLEYINKKQTKVTLLSVPGAIGIFYCWICRNQLLQFMNGKVIKLPNFKLMEIPFTMNCVNPDCPATYKIIDII